MGRTYDGIDDRLRAWLEAQPVFFVASAPLGINGHINLSPKGNRRELAVVGRQAVAYLEQTGSGAETIAHLRENGRIVLMACAFKGPPRIVRLHGQGRVITRVSGEWSELAARIAANGGDPSGPGVRAIIHIDVTRIADSCGYGVPFMAFESHRSTMDDWSVRKGADGIAAYQAEKNGTSIDGLPALR